MDLRRRPWKKLRVVVEVTVPPTSRATEKDLRYAVEEALPHTLDLPRPGRPDTVSPVARIKTWGRFFTAARIAHKKGIPL